MVAAGHNEASERDEGSPRAQEGDLRSPLGSDGAAVVLTEAQEMGTESPAIQRTAGTRKGLCVPSGSLGPPSPGLPGPARPRPLQAQLQAGRLPQASHPTLLGRDPFRPPAWAPRRPQLRNPPNRRLCTADCLAAGPALRLRWPRPQPPTPTLRAISGSTRK